MASAASDRKADELLWSKAGHALCRIVQNDSPDSAMLPITASSNNNPTNMLCLRSLKVQDTAHSVLAGTVGMLQRQWEQSFEQLRREVLINAARVCETSLPAGGVSRRHLQKVFMMLSLPL